MFKKQWLIIGVAAMLIGSMQGCAVRIASGANASKSPYDRRTDEIKNADAAIEWKACTKIRDRFGDAVHVNCKSFNYTLLITGEVSTDSVKTEAEGIATAIAKVRRVQNYLSVGPLSSVADQNKDRVIESSIRARGKDHGKLNSEHVTVMSESGVVYALGVVSQREADSAMDIIGTTRWVKNYKLLFEIITPEQAKALDDAKTGGNTPTQSLWEMLPKTGT